MGERRVSPINKSPVANYVSVSLTELVCSLPSVREVHLELWVSYRSSADRNSVLVRYDFISAYYVYIKRNTTGPVNEFLSS